MMYLYAQLHHTELQSAVAAYKEKTDQYLKRLEEAEISKAKIARTEAYCTSLTCEVIPC